MKKTLLVAICLGFSLVTKAQSNTNQLETESMVFNTTTPTHNEINLHIDDVKSNNQSLLNINTMSLSDVYSPRRKKSKLKPWHYVVGGVAIVAIVALAIIAPNGVNSREGVR